MGLKSQMWLLIPATLLLQACDGYDSESHTNRTLNKGNSEKDSSNAEQASGNGTDQPPIDPAINPVGPNNDPNPRPTEVIIDPVVGPMIQPTPTPTPVPAKLSLADIIRSHTCVNPQELIQPDSSDFENSPKVSPLDYGAKGDGVTNDTSALQAAALAAHEQSAVLVIPPGVFAIDGLITLRRNIKAVLGKGGTIKFLVADRDKGLLLQAGQFTTARPGRFPIRDLIIDANLVSKALPIYGQNASKIDLVNNRIINMRAGTAIVLRAFPEDTINPSSANIIYNNDITGVVIDGSEAEKWTAIHIDAMIQYPTGITDAIQNWKTTFTPPVSAAQSFGTVIHGNRIDGSYYAVSLSLTSESVIYKNTLTNNIRNISIQDTSHNNVVCENTLRNSKSSSIHLAYGSYNNRIEKNDIVTSRAAGEGLLQAYAGAKDNRFKYNTVKTTENGRPTFMAYSAVHVTGNQFIGNIFEGNVSKAYIGVESAWYTGTTETSSRAYGLPEVVNDFASVGSSDITILDNQINATSTLPVIYLGQFTDPKGSYPLSRIVIQGNKVVLPTNGIALKFFEATPGQSSDHKLIGNSFLSPNGSAATLLPRGKLHFGEIGEGQGLLIPAGLN